MAMMIYPLQWTPEGRRLVTGASSGEFTLWNGLTFNFETILQVWLTTTRCHWHHLPTTHDDLDPVCRLMTRQCDRWSGATTATGWWPLTTTASSSTGRAIWTTSRCSRSAFAFAASPEKTRHSCKELGLWPSAQSSELRLCWVYTVLNTVLQIISTPVINPHEQQKHRVGNAWWEIIQISYADDDVHSLPNHLRITQLG